MDRLQMATIKVCLSLVTGVIAAWLPSQVALAEPIHYVNTRKITVPYRLSANIKTDSVQLWGSENRGKTWVSMGSYPSETQSFTFTAKRDGIFSFKTSAKDVYGNVEAPPKADSVPDVSVIIDTQPPTVTLLEPLAGDIMAGVPIDIEWEAKDENMKADGIHLEITFDNGKNWATLAAEKLRNTGKYRWFAREDLAGLSCLIRVTATDLGGNIQRDTMLRPLRFYPPEEEDPIDFSRIEDDDDIVIVKKDGKEVIQVTDPKQPNNHEQSTAPTAKPASVSTGSAGPQHTNRRKFDIHYRVGNVGPSGLGSVTLWYTRDGGTTWKTFGSDPDLKSPVTFLAPQSGLYGFAVEITNLAGKSSGRPKAGTKPKHQTLVDFTPPSVLLESPNGGDFLVGGNFHDITWHAQDTFLAPKPISIYVSNDSGVNWTLLVKDIDNSANYRWQLPVTNGKHYRLRLEVRDQAGNIGTALSSSDFTIDSTMPSGEVEKIAPASQAYVAVNGKPGMTGGTTLKDDVNFPRPSINPRNDRLSKLAAIYRNRGDYNQALAAYEQLLEQYPNNEDIHYDQAVTYYEMGRKTKAIEAFTALIRKDPNNGRYHRSLGIVFYSLQKFPHAEHLLRNALQLNARDEDAWWYLANIYMHHKMLVEAHICWQKIIANNATNSLLVQQAKDKVRKFPLKK